MELTRAMSFLLVIALVALAPLLAALIGRVLRIPLVVYEIVLGLVFGPAILGWAQPTDFLNGLQTLGLAMLFFLAGNEIDFQRINGRPLRRSAFGWLISLVLGVTLGIVLAPSVPAGVFIGVALTSTALGTLMPMLRDAGELRTPFGTAVIAIGAVGEFGPLIAISIFLSGRNPGAATVVLLVFVLIAAGAIYLAARGTHRQLHTLINATLHTSGQFAVRLVMLLVVGLVTLSALFGLDMLLGAFAAGVITKLLLEDAAPRDAAVIEAKLEAIGFGFLVPIFFVYTGLTFDLQALLSDPQNLIMLPIFLVLLLLVRGSVGLLTAPVGTDGADRRAIVLLCATGLPIIVAVTGIGVESGDLPVGTASALVGAGMLSVLLFPLIAFTQRHQSAVMRTPDVDGTVPENA